MPTEPLAPKSFLTDPTLWTPVGIAVGSAIGYFIHDTTFGLSVGMMTGGVVAMFCEKKRKKPRSWLVIGVGVLAIVVVIATRVIDRA
jgi:hypothetical protein